MSQRKAYGGDGEGGRGSWRRDRGKVSSSGRAIGGPGANKQLKARIVTLSDASAKPGAAFNGSAETPVTGDQDQH